MPDILKQTALLDALTDKQREVIALVAEGMTSKEIARKIGISESAVNQRIEVIRQRLDGMSRAQIARLYRQTSTLVITIPTSNSLTGKPIQLQSDYEVEQQSSPEGVEDVLALANDEIDELQPSTFSPLPASWVALHGPSGPWIRAAAIVLIAVGLLAAAILVLAVARTVTDLAGH
ncbi:MAG TPA: helix-turn-helix transcriptional regulator [Novosphingobium sp.]|nr:helix-turn-helix transcriptional regulator [Novosphingobium sp.]